MRIQEMGNQISEDGSLYSAPQIMTPILTVGAVYDGTGELPEPQSSDEIIAAATALTAPMVSSPLRT